MPVLNSCGNTIAIQARKNTDHCAGACVVHPYVVSALSIADFIGDDRAGNKTSRTSIFPDSIKLVIKVAGLAIPGYQDSYRGSYRYKYAYAIEGKRAQGRQRD